MGRSRRGGTRRSRTSTRSAGCTSSSRGTACGRPTSSRIRSRRDRAVRRRCCARLLARGDCEIGAHHHAWETPPCATPTTSHRHPYALSLPLEQFDAQLASLTEAIRSGVGVPPRLVSIRAASASRPRTSRRSSSRAISSSRAWRRCSTKRTNGDRISSARRSLRTSWRTTMRRAPGTSDLLELPISAALNRRVPAMLERWYGRAPWPYTTKRVLRLLRIAHVRWLRPSYSSAEDMIALARQTRRARRADPQPAVPLERGHRRRQSVQPHRRASSQAFFDRLRTVADVRDARAGRRADDVRGVPPAVRRRTGRHAGASA